MFRKKGISFPDPRKAPYIRSVTTNSGDVFEFDGVDTWRKRITPTLQRVNRSAPSNDAPLHPWAGEIWERLDGKKYYWYPEKGCWVLCYTPPVSRPSEKYTGKDAEDDIRFSQWLDPLLTKAFNAGRDKERARLLKVIEDNDHPIWEVGHFQKDLIDLIHDEYSYEDECKICRDCNDHWHHKSRICENCGGKAE